MHVDNVFEVFIFLILIFGYFFYARRGAYLITGMFIMLKTFSGASRHNAKKSSKIQATMQYHPINAESTLHRREKKFILQTNYTIVITSGFWFWQYTLFAD